MFKGINITLENIVVEVLSKHGNAHADFLHKKIQQLTQTTISIQGVYRILRKLQQEGVVIKERQAYSLRIPWILDLSQQVATMEQTYLQSTYIQSLLPNHHKGKKQWTFTNILKMNDFWSQLLLAMVKARNGSIALDYTPHPWYHLMQTAQELQYLKTYLSFLKKAYFVVGGRTPLDYWTETFWYGTKTEYYFADTKEWICPKRTFYLVVVADLVNIVQIDLAMARKIDHLYDTTKSYTDLHMGDALEIFMQPVKIKMTLEKNADKAAGYYKKFTKLFGPLRP